MPARAFPCYRRLSCTRECVGWRISGVRSRWRMAGKRVQSRPCSLPSPSFCHPSSAATPSDASAESIGDCPPCRSIVTLDVWDSPTEICSTSSAGRHSSIRQSWRSSRASRTRRSTAPYTPWLWDGRFRSLDFARDDIRGLGVTVEVLRWGVDGRGGECHTRLGTGAATTTNTVVPPPI